MKVTYDRKAKALYIKISSLPAIPGIVKYTEEFVPDEVMLDITEQEEIYGIDVLGVEEIEEI